MRYLRRDGVLAVGTVTAIVLAVILLGVAVEGSVTPSVGAVPDSPTARMVQGAVLQAEHGYFLAPGPAAPIVGYVVTTPDEAYGYLSRISWSNAFYSSLDCQCTISSTQPVGESGTTEAELSLIPEERGPVALVELSGATLDYLEIPVGGPLCAKSPCQQPALSAYEAPVAFLVVNLRDGKTTGGMLATPSDGASSFALDGLGPVTSWTGPSAFGNRPSDNTHIRIILVDTPYTTGR